MNLRWPWLMLVACLLLIAGCADGEPALSQIGQARDVPVIAAELGGSYRLSVEPARGEATGANVKLLRFWVPAGTTFAAVMRRSDDSELDAYLALYPASQGEGALAISDYDQALVPMAAEEDAALVHRVSTDQEFLLFAADRELEVSAEFQIDLVTLPVTPSTSMDLTATHPGLRAVMGELRELEPEIDALLSRGALVERDDGFVDTQLVDMPLSERAAVSGLAARVNDLRELLYHEQVRAELDRDDDALAEQVGQLCGALWSALRGGAHRLNPR